MLFPRSALTIVCWNLDGLAADCGSHKNDHQGSNALHAHLVVLGALWVFHQMLRVQGQIKDNLFSLVLRTSPAIRKQLNEALSIIAASDFPKKWTTLLPELVNSVRNGTLEVQVAALDAMSSIFQPFRKSTIEESNETLDYCQTEAGAAVLDTVEKAGLAATAAAGKRDKLQQLCALVRLGNDIVFSLNVFGLSIHMEQYADRWINVWKAWLEMHDETLKEADGDVESAECVLGCFYHLVGDHVH